MDVDLFTILAVGLGQWETQGFGYPYPRILQHGMNLLAARMLTKYPATIDRLLDLFEQPLSAWWETGWGLPDEIDTRFGLLADQRLDEQTQEFLDQEYLPGLIKDSVQQLVIYTDNQLVRDVVEEARQSYDQEPDQAEMDYEQVRRFLIEHPYTTPDEIGDSLYNSPFRNEVANMYQEASSLHQLFGYDPDRTGAAYWCCPICGMLRIHNGQLVSPKSTICSIRCPGAGEWKRILPSSEIRVLRLGIQLRTMIPGVVELAMYNWLKNLQEAHPRYIEQVSLWPGVDRYDLRVAFSDTEVWAVDIKDYKSPKVLAKEISRSNFYQLEDRLSWTRSYYVVPSDREDSWPGYLEIARNTAQMPGGISLITTQQFENLVEAKLAELR